MAVPYCLTFSSILTGIIGCLAFGSLIIAMGVIHYQKEQIRWAVDADCNATSYIHEQIKPNEDENYPNGKCNVKVSYSCLNKPEVTEGLFCNVPKCDSEEIVRCEDQVKLGTIEKYWFTKTKTISNYDYNRLSKIAYTLPILISSIVCFVLCLSFPIVVCVYKKYSC